MLNLLQALVDRSPLLLQSVDENGDTPLHVACETNAPIQVTRFMLETDEVPVRMANRAGALPVHASCGAASAAPVPSEDVIQLLLERGGAGTLRVRDVRGGLPVHVACRAGAPIEVIQLLVERGGADTLWERDGSGALPVHTACCRAGTLIQVIQCLIENGGVQTLVAMDNNGSPPLHLFCGSGPSLQTVQTLGRLYPGFQSTRTRRGDWPVLTAAASAGSSLDVVYQLLRLNPDVSSPRRSSDNCFVAF